MITPASAASELLARRRARASLLEFTRYTKPDFNPGTHHGTIASALERVERGECRRLMIFAPPRHTKSELASRRFPAWYLGRHPNRQLITSTYASEFAQDFGRDVREIVQDDTYRRLFDMSLAADSTSRGRWHTDRGGVYFAVGVGGPITGRGAHLALIDDPVKNRQDAESETIRESVWHWYTSTLRTRLMPGGAIVLICTRWHEDDLAGRLLEAQKHGGEQWEVVSLPAIRHEDGEDKALWPEWYPIEELHQIKGAIGPRDWLSLYQQTPTVESGTYFKREWMQRYTDLPEHMTVYMSGDFAVTDGGGDFTEIGVWGVDTAGRVFMLDWWHGQTSADVWVKAMVSLAEQWKPIWFIGETGPIRRAVEPILREEMESQRHYFATEWLSGGDKAANARPFQALCSMRKVHFPATDKGERVIDQLLRFPAGKHDDAVDACGLFGRFIDKTWKAVAPKKQEVPNWDAPVLIRDLVPDRAAA
jgi:hypothetical protein